MSSQIFETNSLSTSRKKKRTTIENSFGAIDISKKDEKISIDLRRKSEYFEPIHENSREKLEDGHKTSKKTSSGEVSVDSKNKDESAVSYKEKALNSNEKIMKNLHKLKGKIYNQTLFELLPEDYALSKKIELEIEQIKNKSDEIILSHLSNISEQIIDEGIEENPDENVENEDI